MEINGVPIEDTYAEAFGMHASRVIITARDERWALEAAQSMTGFGTSVIGCGCETGMEGPRPAETPDDRPGVGVLIFAMSRKRLEEHLVLRIGQCVMTAATAACYNGLEGEASLRVGGKLRFFGDGYQISKTLDPPLAGRRRRFWRIPIMSGEFLVEDRFDVLKGVGGGNFLLLGEDPDRTLQAAEAAVAAIREVPGVILPFPGGLVSSGSKVGSRYKFLRASTNSPYCPTLRGQVESSLPEGVKSVIEIVIDGLTVEAVAEAMRRGIRAACRPGILGISAGNYGGRLGKHHFPLRRVLA